jgi:hypothetical protein
MVFDYSVTPILTPEFRERAIRLVEDMHKDGSSTRAWIITMLLASLFTLLPWLGYSPFPLLMTVASQGLGGWPPIYFLYPLVLLIFSAVAWRMLGRGKYRRARGVAVVPIELFIFFGGADLGDRVSRIQHSRQVTAHRLEHQRQHPEGPFPEWYASGEKKSEGRYDKLGIKWGLVTTWYANGQKKSEVTGSMALEWHEDGRLLTEIAHQQKYSRHRSRRILESYRS